jgi:AP-1 complex subunit mu
MVASAVFITDLHGKSIISRNYRGDVPLNRAIERFAKYLSDTPDEQKKPIFQTDACGDFFVEDDVGSTGNQGAESYVYVNVSLHVCIVTCCAVLYGTIIITF